MYFYSTKPNIQKTYLCLEKKKKTEKHLGDNAGPVNEEICKSRLCYTIIYSTRLFFLNKINPYFPILFFTVCISKYMELKTDTLSLSSGKRHRERGNHQSR